MGDVLTGPNLHAACLAQIWDTDKIICLDSIGPYPGWFHPDSFTRTSPARATARDSSKRLAPVRCRFRRHFSEFLRRPIPCGLRALFFFNMVFVLVRGFATLKSTNKNRVVLPNSTCVLLPNQPATLKSTSQISVLPIRNPQVVGRISALQSDVRNPGLAQGVSW